MLNLVHPSDKVWCWGQQEIIIGRIQLLKFIKVPTVTSPQENFYNWYEWDKYDTLKMQSISHTRINLLIKICIKYATLPMQINMNVYKMENINLIENKKH